MEILYNLHQRIKHQSIKKFYRKKVHHQASSLNQTVKTRRTQISASDTKYLINVKHPNMECNDSIDSQKQKSNLALETHDDFFQTPPPSPPLKGETSYSLEALTANNQKRSYLYVSPEKPKTLIKSRILLLITDTHTNTLRLVMTQVDLCCTRQSRAPNIERCEPKFDLDLWSCPVTLALTFDLDLDTKDGYSDVKTRFLAFDLDLDLQSQPCLGPGRPPCQKSRSKVTWFSRESVDWRTDGRTDRQTDGRYKFYYLPASLKLRGR